MSVNFPALKRLNRMPSSMIPICKIVVEQSCKPGRTRSGRRKEFAIAMPINMASKIGLTGLLGQAKQELTKPVGTKNSHDCNEDCEGEALPGRFQTLNHPHISVGEEVYHWQSSVLGVSGMASESSQRQKTMPSEYPEVLIQFLSVGRLLRITRKLPSSSGRVVCLFRHTGKSTKLVDCI